MAFVTVELRNVEGTEAALGWAGGHMVVIDRPEGKAGGQGLGFNGGQLLALAIGGCFCNDLRYVAHDMRVGLGKIAVSVTIALEGEPLTATSATMAVSCETLDGSDPQRIIDRAMTISTVANSLQRGIAVKIE
jgi:organic hydroperoxide reductase OsmC/OhrA